MDKILKCLINAVIAVCLAGCITPADAASPETLIQKGNTLFASGKYDDAIAAYDEAAADDPESPVIYFNKGAALYQKEEYTAAREAFGKAAVKTKDPVLEAKSKFNLGLCFFREGERQKDTDLQKTMEFYQSSIASFQEALTITPEFKEAAENIEMVRLMMKALLDEIQKQEEAVKRLTDSDLKTAADHQEASLDDLRKALEALKGDPKNQGQDQARQDQGETSQAKSTEQEPADSQDQQQKEHSTASADGETGASDDSPSDPSQEPGPSFQLMDDADAILNEEKENQKERMRMMPGGFQPVDKDW